MYKRQLERSSTHFFPAVREFGAFFQSVNSTSLRIFRFQPIFFLPPADFKVIFEPRSRDGRFVFNSFLPVIGRIQGFLLTHELPNGLF